MHFARRLALSDAPVLGFGAEAVSSHCLLPRRSTPLDREKGQNNMRRENQKVIVAMPRSHRVDCTPSANS